MNNQYSAITSETSVPTAIKEGGLIGNLRRLVLGIIFPAPAMYPGFKSAADRQAYIDTNLHADMEAFLKTVKRAYSVGGARVDFYLEPQNYAYYLALKDKPELAKNRLKAINMDRYQEILESEDNELIISQVLAIDYSNHTIPEEISTPFHPQAAALVDYYAKHQWSAEQERFQITETGELHTLRQPDNKESIVLRGIEMQAVVTANDPQPNRVHHVFYLMGNMTCREQLYSEMARDIDNAKANGILLVAHAINPRGVGDSSGRVITTADLSKDYADLIANYIQDKDISPTQITLKCHSLGAGYGVVAAKQLHDKGLTVNIHHGRSFATPAAAIFGNNRFLVWLGNIVLKSLGLQIDAKKAWESLPDECKSHIVAKRGKHSTGDANSDGVIKYGGSLHYSQKAQRTAEKQALRKLIAAVKTIQASGYAEQSIEDLIQFSESQREKLTVASFKEALAVIQSANWDKYEKWYQLEVGGNLDLNQNAENLIRHLGDLDAEKFKANKFTHKYMGHNMAEEHLQSRRDKKQSENGESSINASQYFVDRLKKRVNFHEQQSAIPTKPVTREIEEDVLNFAANAVAKHDEVSREEALAGQDNTHLLANK